MNDLSDERRADLTLRATRRAGHEMMMSGILIAPATMTVAWYVTDSMSFVNGIGVRIFGLAAILFTITFAKFQKYSRLLGPVRQPSAVDVRGIFGLKRKSFETKYMFDQFTAEQFEAHNRMYLWGFVAGFAFFVLCGYALSLDFGPFFWR